MPVLRSRFYYTVASDGKSDHHVVSRRSTRIPSMARNHVADTQQQRIDALEQEKAWAMARLAQQDQDNHALRERLHAQSLRIDDLYARCANQEAALGAAKTQRAFLVEKLLGIDREKTRLVETTTRIQKAMLHEIRTLMSLGIRFDVKDVEEKRSKISSKELDAQLDWHRSHRGLEIPRTGARATKVARWRRAVQEYITDVEERLAMVPILDGYIDGEPSESAMSVVSSSVDDRMDID